MCARLTVPSVKVQRIVVSGLHRAQRCKDLGHGLERDEIVVAVEFMGELVLIDLGRGWALGGGVDESPVAAETAHFRGGESGGGDTEIVEKVDRVGIIFEDGKLHMVGDLNEFLDEGGGIADVGTG